MAKVKELKLCTSCHAELPEPVPTSCQACGIQLAVPQGTRFVEPNYLTKQRFVFQLDTDAIKSPKERGEQEVAYDREFVLWLRACPDRMRFYSLMDALQIMEQIVHSNASAETVKKVTIIGKRLGELATAIANYYDVRGRHHGTPSKATTQAEPEGSELREGETLP